MDDDVISNQFEKSLFLEKTRDKKGAFAHEKKLLWKKYFQLRVSSGFLEILFLKQKLLKEFLR